MTTFSIREHLHQHYKKSEIKDHYLRYLFLEITRNCNLVCRHCGSDCTAQTTARQLTTESWIRILERIASDFSPLPTLVLTGGEPIIHPEFSTLIRSIKNQQFRWGIVSNGYALDQNKLSEMIQQNLYSITVSLDGLEASHNWLRGKKDSFAQTIDALRRIGASPVPIKDVVTCVTSRNLSELDVIADLLIDLHIQSWRLFRIFPSGRAKKNPDLDLSKAQTREMIGWIEDRKPQLKKRGLDLSLSCEGWLPFATDKKVRNHPFFCRAGINIASILCDGTITGCSNNDQRFYQGNVLNDNFGYVWNNRFETLRNRQWVKHTSCGSCCHYDICEGGSIHLWRNYDDKPDFCYADCVG